MIIYICIAFSMGLAIASIISHISKDAGVHINGLFVTTIMGLSIVVATGYGVRYLTQGTARAIPQVAVMDDSKIPPAQEQPREVGYYADYKVTAYCPCSKCCGKYADGVTASGHKIMPGDAFVAAPKSLKFGTMVVVPGYNNNQPVPVLDRGGAIKEGRLDLFFPTHQEALNWGVQFCNVLVKE